MIGRRCFSGCSGSSPTPSSGWNACLAGERPDQTQAKSRQLRRLLSEDGGPYIEKPRLFESLGAYLADAPRSGFFVRREAGGTLAARGRWSGREVELLVLPDGSADFWAGAAELRFDSLEAAAPSEARIFAIPAPEGHVVPVGHYHALRALVTGLFAPGAISWVTAMSPTASRQ